MKLLILYEYYMYGPLPDMSGEKVSFKLGEWQERKETVTMPDESKVEAAVKVASLRIEVENHGKKSGFDTIVTQENKDLLCLIVTTVPFK